MIPLHAIPDEVRERMRMFLAPGEELDPSRVSFFARAEWSRCEAWVRTLKHGAPPDTWKLSDAGYRMNPYRKAHTELYWCYYLKYLPEVSRVD